MVEQKGAQWSTEEVSELSKVLKEKLDIKDRKYRFKTYKKCFVGKDCVKFLIENGVRARLWKFLRP